MQKRIKDLIISRYGPALILAVVAVLSYALLLPAMGFYWDDLPMSWIRYELGPEAMTRYFSNNRPVWGWLYQITTRIFPQVPIYWQAFALLWRWIGALLVWKLVRTIWPAARSFALSVSLLFLIYPGFNAQWASYLYSHFFIVLAIFLGSLLCMSLTIRRPSPPLTALALLLSALNLWMMEYFFALELARGAVIWSALGDQQMDRGERLRRTLRLWAPYLVVFAVAILSRVFIFNNQVYGLGLLPRLKTDFLATIVSLLQNAIISFWTVSAGAWAQVVQLPNPAVHGPRTVAVYVAAAAAVFGLTAYSLWRRASEADATIATPKFAWAAIGLGAIMLPFASVPFWLIDLPVTLGFPANRFTLPSMLAVSLILGGALQFIRSARLRSSLLALLVALAAGRQLLWASDFARDWASQKNLFWQMIWRAPGLEPGTMVLMNEELEFYADNSLSAALNWIYDPENDGPQIHYVLLYPTNRLGGSLPALEPGLPIQYDFLAGVFDGSTSRALAFNFSPPACLRLLDPVLDGDNHFILGDSLMREAAALSSPGLILSESKASMPDIYGPEPAHGWCYFFERAELARQNQEWLTVAELGDQAFMLEDHPNDPTERFVFIEGYAHAGEWEKALQYTQDSYKVSRNFVGPLLCKLWDRIEQQVPASDKGIAAIAQARANLDCVP